MTDTLEWPTPEAVDPRLWRWPHFTPRELACKGSGRLLIHPGTLDRLERLRAVLGHPLPISSGYRSPGHNAAVSSTGEHGPHTTGQAVDILVSGERVWRLLREALALEFLGVGVAQKGPHGGRFVHLDDLPDSPGCARPRVWSY